MKEYKSPGAAGDIHSQESHLWHPTKSSSLDTMSYYSGSYYEGGGRRSASYTLRIPCEKFESFLSGLSRDFNVIDQYLYSENVTLQYVDLEARIDSLKAQQDPSLGTGWVGNPVGPQAPREEQVRPNHELPKRSQASRNQARRQCLPLGQTLSPS